MGQFSHSEGFGDGPQLMTKPFPNIYKLCPGIYAAGAFPDSVARSRSVNKSGAEITFAWILRHKNELAYLGCSDVGATGTLS